MDRRIKITLLLGIIIILGPAACKNATEEPTQAAPTLTVGISTQPYPLATPYAQQPAAGICASPTGGVVKVALNPDIPDPRCTKVNPDQKLNVINNTQNTLEVSIGRFSVSLEPGEDTTFETPFGEYLAPGVHQLQVSPCCGAELWLEGR